MGTLHLLNRSPDNGDTLDACLRTATEGSAILLLGDGVLAALHPGKREALDRCGSRGIRVHVLQPDLEARGLGGQLPRNVIPVDHAGFVDLVASHERCVSWF